MPILRRLRLQCKMGQIITVLLKPGETKEMSEKMLDLVVDLELECDKVLSVLRIDYDKFTEWEDVMPFYKNVKKDGVVLWEET